MNIELWSKENDKHGLVIDVSHIKQRVFLENHTLLKGLDVSEVDTLNFIYKKTLFTETKTLDNMEFLIEISTGKSNLISYLNRYLEIAECIVFNHNNNKFESLIEKYSGFSERYIEVYNEYRNPVILRRNDFCNISKLIIDTTGCNVSVDKYEDKRLYKIQDSKKYILIDSNSNSGIKKGVILSEFEAKRLFNEGAKIIRIH